MKRPKIPMIGGLFVLFLLVMALLYFSDDGVRDTVITLRPTASTSPTPAPLLFEGLTGGEIVALQLSDPHSQLRLTLEYTNTGWQALEYADQTVSQQDISYILTTLANLPYQRSFAIENTTSLGQYGFFPNGQYLFRIQFITMDGNSHIIAVGNPSSDHLTPTPNQAFYALVDEVPQMYLVNASAIYYLIDKMSNPPLE